MQQTHSALVVQSRNSTLEKVSNQSDPEAKYEKNVPAISPSLGGVKTGIGANSSIPMNSLSLALGVLGI